MNCRFCLEAGHESEFLSPCACDGSMKYVHTECLSKWIATSKSDRCNVCKSKYDFVIINLDKEDDLEEDMGQESPTCLDVTTWICVRFTIVVLMIIVFI